VLLRAQQGDENAFFRLWRDVNPALVRYLQVMTRGTPRTVLPRRGCRWSEVFGASAASSPPGGLACSRCHDGEPWMRIVRRAAAVWMAAPTEPESVDCAEIALEQLDTRSALRLVGPAAASAGGGRPAASRCGSADGRGRSGRRPLSGGGQGGFSPRAQTPIRPPGRAKCSAFCGCSGFGSDMNDRLSPFLTAGRRDPRDGLLETMLDGSQPPDDRPELAPVGAPLVPPTAEPQPGWVEDRWSETGF